MSDSSRTHDYLLTVTDTNNPKHKVLAVTSEEAVSSGTRITILLMFSHLVIMIFPSCVARNLQACSVRTVFLNNIADASDCFARSRHNDKTP